MKVLYAPRALRDVDDILSYVQERNPQAAGRLSLAIEHTISHCALHPRAGSKTDEPDLYRWPIARYRYTIFYRLRAGNDGIEVARVIHGARVKDLRKLPDGS
jgi:plasmid stabilization system protein ParE